MALRVTKTVEMVVTILILIFCVPYSSAISLSSYIKLPLPPGAMGPKALAFSSEGEGPYTGVLDGRVLKYEGSTTQFREYAFDFPTRLNDVCIRNTDSSASGGLCGRPLGVGLQPKTGDLYIADATYGLLVANSNGRVAQVFASGAEGQTLFVDGLDIQQDTGFVFATVASTRFDLSTFEQAVATKDSSGRLIKYDPNRNTTTVLLSNLFGPGGCAVSSDGSYVLVSEFIANRIQKYWISGPKANTSEVLIAFPEGSPCNIKRTPIGGYFWVAVNVKQTSTAQNMPTAVKFDHSGHIVANLPLNDQYNTTIVSEVHEYDGALYIGTATHINFVGKYKIV